MLRPLGTLMHVCFKPSMCSTAINGSIITYRVTDYKLCETKRGTELLETVEAISISDDWSMWWQN
jgi:hypothetical protein